MNLDYLAGLIDGEGCLTISVRRQYNKETFRPYITITNTDKVLIDAVYDFLMSLGVKPFAVQHDRRPGNPRKTCYVISLGGKSALQLAKILDGKLVSKTPQLNVLLRYAKGFSTSNKAIGEEGRDLRRSLLDEIQWINQGCP